MLRNNPMAGPAYVMALLNTLEQQPDPAYKTPPRTGGTQVSIRLDEFIYNHINAIIEKTGWNRSEVLHALIQRGLFDLYEFCSPETVDSIVSDVVAKLAPPHSNMVQIDYKGCEISYLRVPMFSGKWTVNLASNNPHLLTKLGGCVVIDDYTSIEGAIAQAKRRVDEIV